MGTKNKDLLEAFIESGVSADHFTAYKAGAAQGYLMAKRQMVEVIDKRLEIIDGSWDSVTELEKLRDYVRNVMLWRMDD